MENKIFIFVPINIGRNLESLLKRKAPNTEFITPSSSSEELKYFESIFEENSIEKLPELIVTLQPEILRYLEREEVRDQFVDFDTSFPALRNDLIEKNLNPYENYIKPLLFTPIIMLVNKELENPPELWTDLFAERFNERIIVPDTKTPVSIAFKFFMKDLANDDNVETFLSNIKYSGLPFDVITGVNKGYYDVGLLPLPFIRYSMGKNLNVVYPKEGTIIIPEMMFLRKNASQNTIEIARYLLEKNVQRFFSQLGALIPVIEEIPLPAEIKNNPNFYWKGWEWYNNLATK
jgi:ABC-type Fe3+ transport system substrate-binding protein